MLKIQNYKKLTHIIFLSLICTKLISVQQGRIEIILFLSWIAPLIFFYFYINMLRIRAYQWFCFILLIYFLSSSLRVFGTNAYWLDIVELLLICSLFTHIMFGPKTIKNIN